VKRFFYYKQIGYIVSIAYIQLNYVAFTCNTLKLFFEKIYYEEVIKNEGDCIYSWWRHTVQFILYISDETCPL